MRASLDWLAEFIDLPGDRELVDRLTLCGFEDVEIRTLGPDLSRIRVGRVRERVPHPNADRLSVCKVDFGAGDPVEVVCGAPNVAADQKIAFAIQRQDAARINRRCTRVGIHTTQGHGAGTRIGDPKSTTDNGTDQ